MRMTRRGTILGALGGGAALLAYPFMRQADRRGRPEGMSEVGAALRNFGSHQIMETIDCDDILIRWTREQTASGGWTEWHKAGSA